MRLEKIRPKNVGYVMFSRLMTVMGCEAEEVPSFIWRGSPKYMYRLMRGGMGVRGGHRSKKSA